MARSRKSSESSPRPAGKAPAELGPGSAAPPLVPGRQGFAGRRSRRQALLIVLGLVGVGLASQAAWRATAPLVAANPRYFVAAKAITVNPPPEWITCDVRAQVVGATALSHGLSVLDSSFFAKVEQAFLLHPWVERVVRIQKHFPPAISVELEYRRPVAVVESPRSQGVDLLPVSAGGVRLPENDVPPIRRRYLPRITGIVDPPPAGQPWTDPRLSGAVELAVRLGDQWDALHLAEIVPSARPEVSGDRRYFLYHLVTQGGTRIVWGPAPSETERGDADFQQKQRRLVECHQRYGPFDSINSPDVIDLRHGVSVTLRQVKKPAEADDPVRM